MYIILVAMGIGLQNEYSIDLQNEYFIEKWNS
jgi:hypothetical protein